MVRLAVRNLLARKARTILSLTGLMIAILGIIALISVSRGMQALLKETLSLVPGITVLQKDVTSLAFSSLPRAMQRDLAKIEGVNAVFGQVWFPAFEVEGENLILKGDPFNLYLVLGVDVPEGATFLDPGPILGGLKQGRPLAPTATAEVVIPRAAANRFQKKLGDKLQVQRRPLDVVGIFQSGSLFFDRCIVVPLQVAREIAGKKPELVSSFYLELKPGAVPDAVAKSVEAAIPGTHAWTLDEVNKQTGALWAELDLFLYAIASIAVFVGGVGIVNTMLMSVMERTAELGVLRATGWTRRDVVRLILTESAALGIGGGLLGCGVGAGLVAIAGALLPVKPVVTATLLAESLALAILLGTLGGLYPAWRASRLNPIEAIRT